MTRRLMSAATVALIAAVCAHLGAPLHAEEALKGQIYYARKSGTNYRIHVMNADGTGDKELAGQTANVNMFPSLSPDGKKIAYMSGADLAVNEYQLMIGKSDGTGAAPLQTGSKITGLAAWSPDGTRLAYVSGDMLPSIFLGDADGNNAGKFTDEGVGGIFPFFSQDGKKLYFTRISPMDQMGPIYAKLLAGGAAETVIPTAGNICFATAHGMSPDGKRLVYSAVDMKAMTASIRLRVLETGSETLLAESKLPAQSPGPEGFASAAWSPDGKWVVYSGNSEKGVGLFRVSQDGQTRVRLTPDGVDCITPAWHGPK